MRLLWLWYLGSILDFAQKLHQFLMIQGIIILIHIHTVLVLNDPLTFLRLLIDPGVIYHLYSLITLVFLVCIDLHPLVLDERIYLN